jgi:hypothetical protein
MNNGQVDSMPRMAKNSWKGRKIMSLRRQDKAERLSVQIVGDRKMQGQLKADR